MKKALKPALIITVLVYLIGSGYMITQLRGELTKFKEVGGSLSTLRNIQAFKNSRGEYDKSVKLTLKNIRDQIKLSFPENPSAADTIRASMTYVFSNSLHLVDEEHSSYFNKTDVFLTKLYKAGLGDEEEKPHLSCGLRAISMRSILNQFDIYSRLVQLYSDSYDSVKGHRVLEVYNPDSNEWEVWDPDYGVTYINVQNGKPVNIMEMVFGNKELINPVGVLGEGWKVTKTDEIRSNYLKALKFEPDSGPKASEFLINGTLFDLEKKFSDGLTFQEWANQYHSQNSARLLVLPGDLSI